MESSIKIKTHSNCTLYMLMMNLLNYEEGIFDLVLHFTTTITIKTNEDLQMKIDTFFKDCEKGYKTMGCMSLWNVFSIKQIDVVFPRKYCCMKDGFKIGNWICQQKPIFKFGYICYGDKDYNCMDDLKPLSFTNYWDNMHMPDISIDVDFEKEKTLILVKKKI